jgi:hypothetical protein
MKNAKLVLAQKLFDEEVVPAPQSFERRPDPEGRVRTLALLAIAELLEQLVDRDDAGAGHHQRWTPSLVGDRVVWRGHRGTMENLPDFVGLAGPLPPFPVGVRLEEEDFVRVVSASEVFAAGDDDPAATQRIVTVSVQDLVEAERRLREEDGGGGTPILDLAPR